MNVDQMVNVLEDKFSSITESIINSWRNMKITRDKVSDSSKHAQGQHLMWKVYNVYLLTNTRWLVFRSLCVELTVKSRVNTRWRKLIVRGAVILFIEIISRKIAFSRRNTDVDAEKSAKSVAQNLMRLALIEILVIIHHVALLTMTRAKTWV